MQWLLDHPGEREPESVYNNWISEYNNFAAQYEGRLEDYNLHHSSAELPHKFTWPTPNPESSPNLSDFPYPQTFSGHEGPNVAMHSTPVSQFNNEYYDYKPIPQSQVFLTKLLYLVSILVICLNLLKHNKHVGTSPKKSYTDKRTI